jgi:two-component system, cell cycle sensor histidine kinase and response regulator CckA
MSDTRPSGSIPEEGADLRERYHRLVELAPDGILIHDGERITMANTAAVRLAGATHRDQLLGRPIDTFLTPPHLKALEERLIDSGEATGTVPAVRDSFRRLDGSSVEVEVTAIPFLELGRPAAHLVIRDITERLSAQEAVRRAEAEKMDTVRTLAGGVAHEVNNMMLIVLGYAEFLTRDGALSESLRQNAVEIQRAAKRATAVSQQLLAFSRRAAGHPQAVALDDAMREFIPVVRQLLGEGRELTSELACPGRIWIDEGQLGQIMMNLALNARDAMPSGGTLAVTTDATEVANDVTDHAGAAVPAGCYARVLVRDTGVGMDTRTLARMFEPFFTTKAVGQGTGLGMSVLDGIMEQSAGYLTVKSAPGMGTTFTLYFPILPDRAARGQRPEQTPDTPDVRTGGTILVVDDEPAIRALAAHSLEPHGFRVLLAADSAVALELVGRQGMPDLVLADFKRAGMDGAELARRLRAEWPDLPVLLMSGYSEEYLRRENMLDFQGIVIQKPFESEHLVAVITNALAAR